MIGAVIAAVGIGGIMYLLNNAWGFGSTELPAPQATLMKLVVEGVMGGTLPWGLVLCGVGIAVVIEILRLPVLPVAIGLYLPIHLSAPIFTGGLLRWFFEKGKAAKTEEERRDMIDSGVLYSSGMIAGEGLVGVLLAVFAVITLNNGKSLAEIIDLGRPLGNPGGILFFLFLLATIVWFCIHGSRTHREKPPASK